MTRTRLVIAALLVVLGAVAIVAGVALLGGFAWALIVAGVGAVAAGLLGVQT